MRLFVTMIDPGSDPPVCQDVLLDVAPGTTLAGVAGRLHDAVGSTDPAAPLLIDGRAVDPDTVLGEAPLLRGAVVVVGRAGESREAPSSRTTARRSPTAMRSMLQLHVVAGPGAGSIVPLQRGTNVVGRAADCQVRLADAGVARRQLEILVGSTGVALRELGPTNRTLVGGTPVPAEGGNLRPGERLSIASTTLVLRHDQSTPAATTTSDGMVRVHRRPRFVTPHRPATVTFPEAPVKPERSRLPLIAALVPLVLSVVLALSLHSPMMMIFAVLTPAMLLGQWWSDRRQGRRSHRRALAEHATATANSRARLAVELADETLRRHLDHPDLARVCQLVSCVDAQLWERRPTDNDYLRLRLGTADQMALTTVEGRTDDPGPVVESVPVVVGLTEVGVLGVTGPRGRVTAVVTAALGQLAGWHSPEDVRIVLLTTDPDAARTWRWTAWLPHLTWPELDRCVSAVGDVAAEGSLGHRIAELRVLLAARQEVGPREAMAARPDVVVVLDGAERLRRLPGVPELLRDGPGRGILVIALDDDPERLPVEARAQFAIDDAPAPRAVLRLPDRAIEDIVPDLPSRSWSERFGRAMAPLTAATPAEGSGSIPDRVDFLTLHRSSDLSCDPLDPDAIGRLWSTDLHSPRALIGTSGDGDVVIDLVRDGPHLLVGGTTGAGKSELLQTLVAGLALASRPDELSFVLIDYKGGAAFTGCARLPHVTGVVTDLDEHLTTRALTSLEAELKRRERLFATVGAKDIDDYRRLARHELPRLGRLVLVVDEFKMLADELPDFVAGLVRLAAIGRSLGVHLVLATQRPAGIISGDMRANISLRIALRMRDRSDSEDVIESPEAATISDRAPGRALIRTAGGSLIPVQTAYASGPANTRPDERSAPQAWPMSWCDLTVPAPAPPAPEGAGQTEEPSALVRTVEAIRTTAGQLGLAAPASPWLPPLPDLVSLDDLLGSGTDPHEVPIGLADRPGLQVQEPYAWRLGGPHNLPVGHLGLAGGSRTGRSTAVRTIALALAERFSPSELHLHVLEGTPGAQAALAALPHVGSVTGVEDATRARRAVLRLSEQLGRTPTARTVLLIDGWEPLTEALDHLDQGGLADELVRLLRDGLASGLQAVVTGGRTVSSGRLAGLLQQRLVLDMSDPLDLTLAGLRPTAAATRRPPGRAIDLGDETEIQLALPGERADPDWLELTRQAAARALTRWGHVPTGVGPWRLLPLPQTVRADQLPEATFDRLVIGVGGDDLLPLGFDLGRDERRIVVSGPPRSGRSTVLETMACRLVASGRIAAVVVSRRSPLTKLGDVPGVHLLDRDDVDRFVALRREHPEMGIVVDDAEALDGTPLEAALVEAARLVESSGGLIAIAVDSRRAAAAFRGLIPEVARTGTGLSLQPTTPADGDIFRVRMPPQPLRRPGLGVIVVDGEGVPIQVAMAASHSGIGTPNPAPYAAQRAPLGK